MLQIEDLQVKLGDKEILKHIDLEIQPGETHILFGPNGSGKTSLLMTIMGYPQYEVVAGKIMFKGEDITHLPINRRTGQAGYRHVLPASTYNKRIKDPADGPVMRRG